MATSHEDTKKLFDIKFKKLFKIMIFAMNVNRSHPNIRRDWKWAIYIIPAHGFFFILYALLIYTIIVHDLNSKDFNQACANGVLTVIFNVTTLQYSIMLVFQSMFRNMIHKIGVDYETAKSFSNKEQEIVLKYAKKGETVVKAWLVLCIITASLFPVKSLVLMIYNFAVNEFRLVHLYDLTYPAIIENVKNDWNVFIVLYILFLFYDLYAMFMYIAFVPLGAIFILHACGQLQLVITRLQGIFEFQDSEYVIQHKLKHIIIHLQDIYSFVQKINESMRVFYELLLKATIVLLPVTFYQIIQSLQTGDVKVEFIAVLFGTIAMSGMPCYYSDMLLETGEKMRLAVYMCGWEYHWDPNTRTLLKFLLLRASRPVALQTMFRIVSLDALTDVYQQAYAIFNLMNAALE